MMDIKSSGGNLDLWTNVKNSSLADVYIGNNACGSGNFDLTRHRGLINILFVDGHVDTRPILSTGAIAASGAMLSAGNTPSGYTGAGQLGGDGLGGVSVARGFN